MRLDVHTVNWREHVGRAVLDPFGPYDEPVFTPTDRRLLWEVESRLAVSATTDHLHDLHAILLAYLRETCEHHWNESLNDYADPPERIRQCLWCNDVEAVA